MQNFPDIQRHNDRYTGVDEGEIPRMEHNVQPLEILISNFSNSPDEL